MRLPARPTVYELNTAVWLTRLGAERGRPLLLDEVPASEWDRFAGLPVDAVWLMGVWERSPAGLQIALTNPGLDAGNRAALPDLCTEDVIGSPYCVREYVVDWRFGGGDALAAAREQLASRGLGLILDYVPNHVAPDHPWLAEQPDCFLSSSEEELAQHPEAFIRTAGGIVANGRDPYFAPWPDVVQLNAFSPALREAVAQTLITVGGQCDGLRCDMAMLMTNEVFARTWGERAGAAPEADYWPTLIGRVREAYPDFLFMAEVYWDMEWTLQQQGFDLCYDKRLYDRLVHEGPDAVRGHLQADPAYQERLIRFIENHDEPRAASVFGPGQARAAAVVISTLEGARLYHDGQFDGFRTHIPVFLARGPDEAIDAELRSFYERLVRAVADSDLRDGDWRLCDVTGWPDNPSHAQLVAWCWRSPQSRHLVVVNLAGAPAQAQVHMPWEDLASRSWTLETSCRAFGSIAPGTRWRAPACTWRSTRGGRTSCGSRRRDRAEVGRSAGPRNRGGVRLFLTASPSGSYAAASWHSQAQTAAVSRSGRARDARGASRRGIRPADRDEHAQHTPHNQQTRHHTGQSS